MSKSYGTIYSFVTKVRTVETIAIEKFFVPGKWLSSLRKSISSMLMTSFNRERTISLFYRFILGTFSFTHPRRLVVFLCFCRFVVEIGCRFVVEIGLSLLNPSS
jgi:hypothetical protein